MNMKFVRSVPLRTWSVNNNLCVRWSVIASNWCHKGLLGGPQKKIVKNKTHTHTHTHTHRCWLYMFIYNYFILLIAPIFNIINLHNFVSSSLFICGVMLQKLQKELQNCLLIDCNLDSNTHTQSYSFQPHCTIISVLQ